MTTGQATIDSKKINLPKIEFTQMALEQLNLILENDFTLSGKYLRILVSGKGCDGFKYSVGFTDREEEDFLININDNLEIIMDPFAAFYLQEAIVDYIQDFKNNNEGFIVKNLNQDEYNGKFWKKDQSKTPPMKEL